MFNFQKMKKEMLDKNNNVIKAQNDNSYDFDGKYFIIKISSDDDLFVFKKIKN